MVDAAYACACILRMLVCDHLYPAFIRLESLSSAAFLKPCRTDPLILPILSGQVMVLKLKDMRLLRCSIQRKVRQNKRSGYSRPQGFTPRSHQSQIYSRSVRERFFSFPTVNPSITPVSPRKDHQHFRITCHSTCPTPPRSVPFSQRSGCQPQHLLRDCRRSHCFPRHMCRATDSLPRSSIPTYPDRRNHSFPLKVRLTMTLPRCSLPCHRRQKSGKLLSAPTISHSIGRSRQPVFHTDLNQRRLPPLRTAWSPHRTDHRSVPQDALPRASNRQSQSRQQFPMTARKLLASSSDTETRSSLS